MEIIKKKWKNTKDNYRKELKKIPQTRSGDPASNYESHWKYFNQMAFMKDQIQPTRNESNIITNFSNDSDDNEDTQDSFRGESNTSNIISSVPVEIYSSTPTPSPSTAPSITSQNRKRKSANDLRSEFLEIEKKKLLLYEAKEKDGKTLDIEKSEDYHYLMSLLPQMEKFTSLQKFRVRNKINSVMMAELPQENLQTPQDIQYGYNTAHAQDNYYNFE